MEFILWVRDFDYEAIGVAIRKINSTNVFQVIIIKPVQMKLRQFCDGVCDIEWFFQLDTTGIKLKKNNLKTGSTKLL